MDIKTICMDYLTGWYNGDVEKMRNCLHPDLAKRYIAEEPETGKRKLLDMNYREMISGTIENLNELETIPKDSLHREVVVFEIFGNIASVKMIAESWIDYVHLGRFHNGWKIVNILWEIKPGKQAY